MHPEEVTPEEIAVQRQLNPVVRKLETPDEQYSAIYIQFNVRTLHTPSERQYANHRSCRGRTSDTARTVTLVGHCVPALDRLVRL